MNNFKKIFTYMVVGALVAALSVSCKLNEEPEVNSLHSNHPPAGSYKYLDDTATVSITSEGCNITGEATHTSVNGGATTREKKKYDITIIKWDSGDGSTDKGSYSRIDGNNYQGEATVTEPTTATSFYVDYSSGRISIQFFDQNKAYTAGPMTKE